MLAYPKQNKQHFLHKMKKAQAQAQEKEAADPVAAQAGDDDDDELEEEVVADKDLPILQNDFGHVDAWTKPKIVMAVKDGKPEVYIIKTTSDGRKVRGTPNIRTSMCKAMFCNMEGVGAKQKMSKEEIMGLEQGFMALVNFDKDMVPKHAVIKEQWDKTFEFFAEAKIAACNFLTDNPTCNADIYTDILTDARTKLSAGDLALENENTLGPDGVTMVKKKNKQINADMKIFKPILRKHIFDGFMSKFQTHWKDKNDFTKDLGPTIYDTFSISSSAKSFKNFGEKDTKTFEQAYPQLVEILNNKKIDNRDIRRRNALMIKDMYNKPPLVDEATKKVTVLKRKFVRVPVYVKRPVYVNGKLQRDSNNKVVTEDVKFGIFDRTLTNQDGFQFDFYMGMWKYGKGFGFLCSLIDVIVPIPRPHVEMTRQAPTGTFDADDIQYAETIALPPVQPYKKRAAAPDNNNNNQDEGEEQQEGGPDMNYNPFETEEIPVAQPVANKKQKMSAPAPYSVVVNDPDDEGDDNE